MLKQWQWSGIVVLGSSNFDAGQSMRTRALRRHQTYRHTMRRLKEDRNQHYDDLDCACYQPGKAMARFKEQPKTCSHRGCGNARRYYGDRTVQERRWMQVSPGEPA